MYIIEENGKVWTGVEWSEDPKEARVFDTKLQADCEAIALDDPWEDE